MGQHNGSVFSGTPPTVPPAVVRHVPDGPLIPDVTKVEFMKIPLTHSKFILNVPCGVYRNDPDILLYARMLSNVHSPRDRSCISNPGKFFRFDESLIQNLTVSKARTYQVLAFA